VRPYLIKALRRAVLLTVGTSASGCGGTPRAEPVAEPFVVEVEDVEVAPSPIAARVEPRSAPPPKLSGEPEPSDLSSTQRKQAAKEAYKLGRKHMKDGAHGLAAERFARADALFAGASPKYYRALCLDRMGKRSKAIEAYRRFIDSDPSQKYLDRVEESKKRIAALRRRAP